MIPAPGPPNPTESPAPGEKARPKNPWADLGLQALGHAVIIKVVEKRTLKSLVDVGLSDSITVKMDERSPLLNVEATADTPTKATATVQRVIALLVAEVAARQQQFRVMPADTITTLTLNDGEDVETVTSKVKRVLIVIVGLGLLITAGGTIGLDALLRWRRRNRALAMERSEETESPRDVGTASGSVTGRRSPVRSESTHPAGEYSEAPFQLPYKRVTGAGDNRQEHGGSDEGNRRSETVSGRPVETVEQIVPEYQPRSTSAEETIVMPRVHRLKQEDRNGRR